MVKSESCSEDDALVASHALSVGATSSWIIDSGATTHMCNDKSLFTKLQQLNHPQEVALGDGHVVKASERGTVTLEMKLPGNQVRKCDVHDVLYVPELSYNLLSVSKAAEAGKTFEFDGERGRIVGTNGKLIGIATKIGNLYYLDCCGKHQASTTTVKQKQYL